MSVSIFSQTKYQDSSETKAKDVSSQLVSIASVFIDNCQANWIIKDVLIFEYWIEFEYKDFHGKYKEI